MTAGDFDLDWNGAAVSRAVDEAAHEGVRQTVEATAEAARGLVPRDTDELHDGIGAAMTGAADGVVTSAAAHTLPVEKGANGVPGVHTFTRAKDREFPRTTERTGDAFKKRAGRIR